MLEKVGSHGSIEEFVRRRTGNTSGPKTQEEKQAIELISSYGSVEEFIRVRSSNQQEGEGIYRVQLFQGLHSPSSCDIMRRIRDGATFDEMSEFLFSNVMHTPNDPQGTQERAMELFLGLQRAAGMFNLENVNGDLMRLRWEAMNADYSEMTRPEIVMSIIERWEQAFGQFRNFGAISYQGATASLHTLDHEKIMRQFNNELIAVFGSIDAANAAYREARFGDKSDAEVRKAIKENFPPMNQITMREFHYMVYEMERVGVDGGLRNVMVGTSRINGHLGGHAREQWLDRGVDQSWLMNNYDILRSSMTQSVRDSVRGTGDVLQELFSLSSQPDIRSNSITSAFEFSALLSEWRLMSQVS